MEKKPVLGLVSGLPKQVFSKPLVSR